MIGLVISSQGQELHVQFLYPIARPVCHLQPWLNFGLHSDTMSSWNWILKGRVGVEEVF